MSYYFDFYARKGIKVARRKLTRFKKVQEVYWRSKKVQEAPIKFKLINHLPKGRFKKKIQKKMVGLIHRGWLAGVSLGPKSNQKKIVLKKKYKDDQNGLIHPENWSLWFFIIGGSYQIFQSSVTKSYSSWLFIQIYIMCDFKSILITLA